MYWNMYNKLKFKDRNNLICLSLRRKERCPTSKLMSTHMFNIYCSRRKRNSQGNWGQARKGTRVSATWHWNDCPSNCGLSPGKALLTKNLLAHRKKLSVISQSSLGGGKTAQDTISQCFGCFYKGERCIQERERSLLEDSPSTPRL